LQTFDLKIRQVALKCFESKEYMYVRCAMLLLTKIAANFPASAAGKEQGSKEALTVYKKQLKPLIDVIEKIEKAEGGAHLGDQGLQLYAKG
jgi:predicted transcriptional regulator